VVAAAKIKTVDMIAMVNFTYELFLDGSISLFSKETLNVSLMLSVVSS
jgi:hypothetical protein